MLKYIDFTNESSNRTSSSLSFYKINEREKDNDGNVLPWSEADLVKFRQLTKDSEIDLKKLFNEKFKQAIYELLTKTPNLYNNSQTEVDKKLNTNFFKSKTKTWTYREIGDWIEDRWNDLVFLKTSFIEAKDKEYLKGLETSITHKEYQVLNGRSSSDAIMSNFIYNYKGKDKSLDSKSPRYFIDINNDGKDDIYFLIQSDSDYWKNRYTKIINDKKINNDEEYKKIFKLINSVTTDFTDLQWKIQGEFISLYVYFMTRLYANAIAKDIESINPNKLKEYIPDEETNAEQTAEVTSAVKQKVKKRKRVVSPTPTYDRENIRRANKSFGW